MFGEKMNAETQQMFLDTLTRIAMESEDNVRSQIFEIMAVVCP